MLALTRLCAATWAYLAQQFLAEWREDGLQRAAIERAAAVSFVLAIAGSFLWSALSRIVDGLPRIDGGQAFIGLTLVFCATEIVTRRHLS